MSANIRLFEVGGHIRDHLMGVDSKDVDYAVEADSFDAMLNWITETHAKVFLSTPDKFTVRALIGDGERVGTSNLVRDYVLCRKEGPYSDGRRPDWVSPGTFEDDIMRRDFTVNALARMVGTDDIIDIVGGINDINTRTLRCVGSAHERFSEDSLRIIRAIRFIVTKGFAPNREIEKILMSGEYAASLRSISTNRKREELTKCFKQHTPAMLKFMSSIHPSYIDAIFTVDSGESLWLLPTMAGR